MVEHFKNIIKNSMIYGLGRVSSKIVGFILLPLYTSHLTTSEYGILGIIEITSQVLIQLLGLRLMAAFHRWYFDADYLLKRKSIFFTLLVFSSFFLITVLGAFSFFSKQLSILLFDGTAHAYLLDLMFLTILFDVLFVIPLTLMKLEEKAFSYAFSQVGKLIVDLFFTVYFIASLNRGVEGIYEAKIIGYLFFFLFASRYILKNIEYKFEFKIIKDMLIFSLPLALSSLSGILLSITDRYTLKYMQGLSDVGIYTLGYKLANTTKIFIVSSIQLAVAPIIFKMMDSVGNKQLYSKILTFMSIVTMFSAVGISLYGKEIVELFARNSNYYDSYKIIPIISLSIFFGMLKDNSTYGIYITKKTSKMPLFLLAVSILNLGLNFIFIPFWNTIGAAVATLISQFILFIMLYSYSNHYYKVNYELKKIFIIVLLGAGVYFLSLLLAEFSIIWRIIFKGFLVISFTVLLFVFRIIDKNEFANIKTLFISKTHTD